MPIYLNSDKFKSLNKLINILFAVIRSEIPLKPSECWCGVHALTENKNEYAKIELGKT